MQNKMALVHDRYDPENLLRQLASQEPSVDGNEWCFHFTVNDLELEIDDFYAYLPEDESLHVDARFRLVSYISEIRRLDNAFQDFCEKEYKASSFSLADFKLHIGWLRVAANVVTVRYWGTVVNTEYELKFAQDERGTWSRIAP